MSVRPSNPYEIRRARRERERERAFFGETLAEYQARANAKPPTLDQVYAENHRNRERCPWSMDLEELLPRGGR